jgi:mono/diheme cytochrome c family protein
MQSRRFRIAVVLGLAVAGLTILPTLAQQPAAQKWEAPSRAARKKNPVAADDKSISAGKTAYLQECRACHGDSGKGDGPSAKDLERTPGDLSKPAMWEQSDGALFWKITEGKKPMPSYDQRFSEDQRWSIVNYIRTFAPKPENK